MMSLALYWFCSGKDGVALKTPGQEAAATTTAACQGCYLVNKPGASACKTWGKCLREDDTPQLSPSPSDGEDEYNVLCFPRHHYQHQLRIY